MRRPVEQVLRVAAFVPLTVVLLHVAFVGGVASRGVLVVVLVVGIILGAVGQLPGGPAGPPPWRVTGLVVIAFGLLTLLLGPGLLADPRRFTLIHAIVIVAAVFASPPRHRSALAALGVVLVGVAVLLDPGTRELGTVAAQVGGSVLVAWVALRVVQALERAVLQAEESRAAAETRAGLLASVLRLQALDLDDVLAAVVDGALEAGCESADVRLGEEPNAVGPGEDQGMLVIPIVVDGEPAGVLVARCAEERFDAPRTQALRLLAEQAGLAIGRARRYATDAATIAELRRLDDLAHDFVSTVSHELRTPLTVVGGLGQTLEERWDELTPPRRQDLIARVDGNAQRLAAMIRSLVDASALEAGRLEPMRTSVPVGPLVERLLGRLETLLEAHPVTTEVADDAVVDADPGLLEHVLENLVGNASTHTAPGTRIVVEAVVLGDEVEIAVVDHGAGIAAEDLPHVTDRFYRAGEPTTRTSGGLGLGLALARQIVQVHGGELTVTSAPGEGARFAFRLPRGA